MPKLLPLHLLERLVDLSAAKMKPSDIAFEIGCSRQSVYTWLNRIKAAGGDYELAHARSIKSNGRPRALEFSEAEANLARYYRLKKESLDVAAWFFIRSDKTYQDSDELIVRPETAEALRFHEEKAATCASRRTSWPMSVKRAFHVTDEERALHEGRKAHQQVEMITRRGMFETLEDGTQKQIIPGNVWELDDYSTNQPYWHECPESGKVSVNRQVLAAKDLCASLWLGFDHIGRERDAYRAEDVLRFIERLVRSHGIPEKLRLERGIWESSGVHGLKVGDHRWGDLRDLMVIEHVFKSKSKSIIEGGFNFLQRWLGHSGIDIGRKRGQFESASKKLRQSRNVTTDARKLGFLSILKSSDKHEAAGRELNRRPAMRAHLNERVSPEDLVARLGWHTKPLSEDDAWYFFPCKQARVVKAGQVRVAPGGGWAPIYFTVNGIIDGLHLETDHKVLVACDPARPELGARVVNADDSAKNRQGFGMHEVLLASAPYFGLAPQFSAAKELSPHLEARKNATAAARTSFRAIVAHGQGPREVTATDGNDKSARAGTIKRAEDATPPAATPVAARKEAPAPATSSRFGRFQTSGDRAAEIARLEKELADADA